MTPEEEKAVKQKSVKEELNRKIIMLFTNQNEMISLMAENNRILMEILLYGVKE